MEKPNFACMVCNKRYKTQRNFISHMKIHPQSKLALNKTVSTKMEDEQEKDITSAFRHKRSASKCSNYECAVCGKKFDTRRCFIRHFRRIHETKKRTVTNKTDPKPVLPRYTCPLCTLLFVNRKDILNHFELNHDIYIETENQTFEDENLFNGWKTNLEQRTTCGYIVTHKYFKNSGKMVIFKCHRSGFFNPKSKNIRSSRLIGSKKINGYCPAEITLFINGTDNNHSVHHVKTHVGHEKDVQFIYKKSTRGQKSRQVCAEIGNQCDSKEQPMTPVNDCNVHGTINNHASLDIENWLRDNESYLLYYKKENDFDQKYPELNAKDLIIIIMNEYQIEMFKKFGGDVIMIDGMQEQNDYKFVMTVTVVFDELRQEVPTSFMFSNRSDEFIYQIFFKELSRKVGKLKPRVFMSDISPVTYNAWLKVMHMPEKRLFCIWHVQKSWKENLHLIKGTIDKKKIVSTYLKKLQDEMDPMKFDTMLQTFLNNEDEDLDSFMEYFKLHFADSTVSWAFCYRQYVGVHSNTTMDSFFKTVEKNYLNGESITSLSEALHIIQVIWKSFYCEELVKLKKGKLAIKIKTLHRRHRQSLKDDINSIIPIDNGWYVPSSKYKPQHTNMDDMYFVQQVSENCDCKLRCMPCDTCLHQFKCPCIDYSIKYNLCKHIHLVCQLRNKLRQDKESLETENSNLQYNIANVITSVDRSSFHFVRLEARSSDEESSNTEEEEEDYDEFGNVSVQSSDNETDNVDCTYAISIEALRDEKEEEIDC